MKVKINSLKDKLFLVLIVSSIFPYITQALYLIRNRTFILWTYKVEEFNAGILGIIIPYIKDITAIVLFLVIFIYKKRKIREFVSKFVIIIYYGILVLLISGNFDFLYIVAGIRAYLFFVVTVMYCIDKFNSLIKYSEIKTVTRVLLSSLYVECFLVFAQVSLSGSWSNFGAGGYRFTGSFGNSGSLGSYSVAIALFVLVAGTKLRLISFRSSCIHFLAILLISVASGMRSAIIIVLVFISIYLITVFYDIQKLSKKTIFFTFLFIIMLFSIPVGSYIVERINRGGIMESGGTRISIFSNLLFSSNIISSLIGYGIGYGTNAAVNLSLSSAQILDGTLNTTIGQFGFIGLVIFLFVLVKTLINIYNAAIGYRLVAFGAIFAILLICVSGNFFEQIAMAVIMPYSIYLLILPEQAQIYN